MPASSGSPAIRVSRSVSRAERSETRLSPSVHALTGVSSAPITWTVREESDSLSTAGIVTFASNGSPSNGRLSNGSDSSSARTIRVRSGRSTVGVNSHWTSIWRDVSSVEISRGPTKTASASAHSSEGLRSLPCRIASALDNDSATDSGFDAKKAPTATFTCGIACLRRRLSSHSIQARSTIRVRRPNSYRIGPDRCIRSDSVRAPRCPHPTV